MSESGKGDGGPAFPRQPIYKMPEGVSLVVEQGGMSLRDYFAAHAPAMPEQWFKDSPQKIADPLWHWGEAAAAWAYFYADAILTARRKS